MLSGGVSSSLRVNAQRRRERVDGPVSCAPRARSGVSREAAAARRPRARGGSVRMPLIEVEAERAAAAVSAAAVPAVVARRASGRLLLLLLRKHTTKGQPLRERRRTHSPHALARPLEPPGAPPPRRRTRGASPRENEPTLDTRERAALERDRRALRWRAARRAARRTAPAAAAAPPGIRATAAPAATAHVAARDTIDIVGRAARKLRVVAVALRRLLAAAPVRAAAPRQHGRRHATTAIVVVCGDRPPLSGGGRPPLSRRPADPKGELNPSSPPSQVGGVSQTRKAQLGCHTRRRRRGRSEVGSPHSRAERAPRR
jgi:hypothetical protein